MALITFELTHGIPGKTMGAATSRSFIVKSACAN